MRFLAIRPIQFEFLFKKSVKKGGTLDALALSVKCECAFWPTRPVCVQRMKERNIIGMSRDKMAADDARGFISSSSFFF